MGNLQVENSITRWERVGIFAAGQSASEISLGSLLHSLHVPFAGHFMANAQGLILAGFVNRKKENKKLVFFVSAIAAALKSLSPSGKRLRPMLGITVQGLLYHAAVNLLGAGLAGAVLGQTVIGAWASFQTFFFQYLFFGKSLLQSYEKIFAWLAQILPGFNATPLEALALWVSAHAALSAAVGALSYWGLLRFPSPKIKLPSFQTEPDISWTKNARQSLAELGKSHFVFPLVFVLAVGWLGKRDWESLAFTAFRAVLIAFLCVLAVQRINFSAYIAWLDKKGFQGPAKALDSAIKELKHENA